MKGKKALLIFFAVACLVLAVAVPLSAQEQGPRTGQRVPPTSTVPKQATPSSALSLERRCREFLASADELRSRFEFTTNEELASTVKQAVRCGELPDIRLLRAAFVAYRIVKDEQDARIFRDSEVVSTTLVEMEQEESKKYEAQLKKQRADFAEVAAFAAALFKEYQQYKEAYEDETRYYDKLKERYHETYDIAVEAINLAGNRLSLPAFVSVPAPQVIRIETPAVPRSLHCTANTMPPAVPGAATWTWTDCHW